MVIAVRAHCNPLDIYMLYIYMLYDLPTKLLIKTHPNIKIPLQMGKQVCVVVSMTITYDLQSPICM